MKQDNNKLEHQPANPEELEILGRMRRHWYDHEKLEIIRKYEAGKLYTAGPRQVLEPKYEEPLPIEVIGRWKSQFKKLGIGGFKDNPESKAKSRKTFEKPVRDAKVVRDMMLEVMEEKNQLRKMIADLDKTVSKLIKGSSSNGDDNGGESKAIKVQS